MYGKKEAPAAKENGLLGQLWLCQAAIKINLISVIPCMQINFMKQQIIG